MTLNAHSPKATPVGAFLGARRELPPRALRRILPIVVRLVIPGAQTVAPVPGGTAPASAVAAPCPGGVPPGAGAGRASPVPPPLGYIFLGPPLFGRHCVRVNGSGANTRSSVVLPARKASSRVTNPHRLTANAGWWVGVAAGLRPRPIPRSARAGGGAGG